jgi:hypothetical protein
MDKRIKEFFFGIKSKKGNDLIPRGINHSIIPSVFIDGNKNPVWENNHKLIQGKTKITI